LNTTPINTLTTVTAENSEVSTQAMQELHGRILALEEVAIQTRKLASLVERITGIANQMADKIIALEAKIHTLEFPLE